MRPGVGCYVTGDDDDHFAIKMLFPHIGMTETSQGRVVTAWRVTRTQKPLPPSSSGPRYERATIFSHDVDSQ